MFYWTVCLIGGQVLLEDMSYIVAFPTGLHFLQRACLTGSFNYGREWLRDRHNLNVICPTGEQVLLEGMPYIRASIIGGLVIQEIISYRISYLATGHILLEDKSCRKTFLVGSNAL